MKVGFEPNHLVVIVGSSGSLSPLVRIVGDLTPELDSAVVVLTHRSAARPSYLNAILSRSTCAPVVTAVDGAVLRRGWVYVAPPGDHHIVIDGRTVRFVTGPKVHLQRPAGDPLLESAARSFGSRAIGVVLSGMGRDGETGVAAIKRARGKVFIQRPSEAEQPSMPEHALRAVEPDLCASSTEIARRLVALCRRSERPKAIGEADARDAETQSLHAAAAYAHD